MITVDALLQHLRPLHVCIGRTGHIRGIGRSLLRLTSEPLIGARFLEVFEVTSPAVPIDMRGLTALAGRVLRLRLRAVPDIALRAVLIADDEGGLIVDLSFGIAVVDAVHRFGLTAQDFSPSDLAVEMLFLHEAKSSAMAASFSLNTRLNGARAEAETRALTDALTGLYNRFALAEGLRRLGQSRTEYAVLHLDLDLFKQVNDTAGHAAGDAVLKQVAMALRRHTRRDDLVVRAGGDEFLVICPGLTETERLSKLAQTLIADISTPLDVEGRVVAVSASIGIGLCTNQNRHEPEQLCQMADIALYSAKRLGRGRHVFWQPELGHPPHLARPDPGLHEPRSTGFS